MSDFGASFGLWGLSSSVFPKTLGCEGIWDFVMLLFVREKNIMGWVGR